jgi:hypothetical protein
MAFDRFRQAAQQAYAFAKEGAALETAAGRFERLAEAAGTTSDTLMIDLRRATRYMLSDAELMSSAGDLMSLGLAKSHDEIVRLSTVASALGMDMNQLVLTLTNQTTMRFDALNLKVDGFEEKVKKLEATGMSASDAFKEAFLQQAEEQMSALGNAADSAIGPYQQFEAAIRSQTEALKMQVSDGFMPLIEALAQALGGWQRFTDEVGGESMHLVDSGASWEAYTKEIRKALEERGLFVRITDDTIQVFRREGRVMRDVTDEFSIHTRQSLEAAKADQKAAEAAEEVANASGRSAGAIRAKAQAMQRSEEWALRTAKAESALAIASAGLAAGLEGELQDAFDQYKETMADLEEEHMTIEEDILKVQGSYAAVDKAVEKATEKLELSRKKYGEHSEQVEKAREALLKAQSGYGANTKKIQELNEALAENEQAQQDAAAAMAEATAQMIFQQASAGLPAQAALDLARSMGILSEADYAVATSLETLRQQYDKDADGAITAGEGADEYTGKVQDLYTAISDLQNAGLDITVDSINEKLRELDIQEQVQSIQDWNEAASAVPGTTDPAATSMSGLFDMAGSAQEMLALVDEKGDGAAGAMRTLASDADTTTGSINWATQAADDFKAALDAIPDRKTVVIDLIVNGTLPTIPGDNPVTVEPDAGGATGLDMTVPPGYPDDSFLVGVTSGERVSVTPAGDMGGGVSYVDASTHMHIYHTGAAVRTARTLARIERYRVRELSMG